MQKRCEKPSTRYVTLGTHGGTGFCVCDEHEKAIDEENAKRERPLVFYSRDLIPGEPVLTTHAARMWERTRCVYLISMPSLDQLFDDVNAWQLATFGAQRDALGPIAHLGREVRELHESAERLKVAETFNFSESQPGDLLRLRAEAAEELADVFMLWVASAQHMGMLDDIRTAIASKLAKNKARKWKAPDADGVIEHEETADARKS